VLVEAIFLIGTFLVFYIISAVFSSSKASLNGFAVENEFVKRLKGLNEGNYKNADNCVFIASKSGVSGVKLSVRTVEVI
jgi:hypothetical protein